MRPSASAPGAYGTDVALRGRRLWRNVMSHGFVSGPHEMGVATYRSADRVESRPYVAAPERDGQLSDPIHGIEGNGPPGRDHRAPRRMQRRGQDGG